LPAFVLTIGIFSFWSILGFAVVSALQNRTNLLRNALLSPVVGSATNVLVASWISVAGVPFKRASLTVTIILLSAAVLGLVRLRPILPVKQLAPFIGTILIGAVLTGYPMFRFGFDWISFANDDMANYALGSAYVSNYGLLNVPPAERIIEDRDVSAFLWYYMVGRGERPGLEIENGWVASAAHLSSHQAYMPVILALHLALICSAGALLLQVRKFRTAATWVCLWMACSSLCTLGAVYQLMGQVYGLALLTGLCALLCTPYKALPRRANIRRFLLISVLFSALLIVYPELLPFFGLTFAMCHGMYLLRGQETWKYLGRAMLAMGGISLVLTNVIVLGVASDTVKRLAGGAQGGSATAVLFPFYLLPSGLAHLWGFYPIGDTLSGAFLSVATVAGAALLVMTCVWSFLRAWEGEAVGVMCAIMIAVGVYCFFVNADFALYKLAMYIQPFLIGVAVLSWFRLCAHLRQIRFWSWAGRPLLFGPLVLVIGAGLTAQTYYVRRSLGETAGSFVEIPRASQRHLISRLIEISHQEHPKIVLADTSNVVLGKIEGMYMAPSPVFFASDDFVGRFVRGFDILPIRNRAGLKFLSLFYPHIEARAQYICTERDKRYRTAQFATHGALPSASFFEVRTDTSDANLSEAALLEPTRDDGIINRRKLSPGDGDSAIRVLPVGQVRDHLLFVSSTYGISYYIGAASRSTGRVSMFQPEADYFYPRETMVSIGRELLFRTLNPTPRFRLVVEYSASLNADHENRIPPVSVVGKERQFLAVDGRGSARLFSHAIDPQEIQGGSYFLLDMGTWGFRFPDHRSGLMNLYGRKIEVDARRITGFARDLSAVSEQEYEDLAAPQRIQSFPHDLANKNLEYSGIYEDGWVAESSYLVLGQRKGGLPLVVRVVNPGINGAISSSRLTLWIDGAQVRQTTLGVGSSELRVSGVKVGKHRIKLVFDKASSLPAPDGRPVSARLQMVGFDAN